MIPDDFGAAPAGAWRRAAAGAEVLGIFVLTHVALKAFKQLSELGAREREAGLNFSPGVFMAVAAVGVLWLARRDWTQYGLGLGTANWLCRPSWRRLGLGLALYVPPLMVILHREGGPGRAALVFGGLLLATAFGEELFFRGYAQSRLNEAFGRPFVLGGVAWGWGLILASALFGLLHTLNTVDYFHARFTFAWGWGVTTFFAGLVYGCLRERSGGIVLPALAHGLWDVWWVAFAGWIRGG